MGTVFNCLLLGIGIPIIGLSILSNYAVEAVVKRWGPAGQVIRWGWLVLTLVICVNAAWFVITYMGPFN